MYIITGHKTKRNQVEIQRKLLLKKVFIKNSKYDEHISKS